MLSSVRWKAAAGAGSRRGRRSFAARPSRRLSPQVGTKALDDRPRALPHQRLEMIRQTQCERDDRQRRGGVAFRRKDRPAGDEEVRDAVNPAVRVHDAAFRVGMHSRHSELMPAALENAGAPSHEVVGERLEPTDAEALVLGR